MLYNTIIMNVGIYFNKNFLSENKPYIEKIENSFKKNGIPCKTVTKFSDLDGLDILFILGGDGTILTVASDCAKRKIKIIGVNYGHLGFLTEFEQDKIDEAISLVTENKFVVKKREMLEISCKDKVWYALNDLVVQRSTCGQNFTNTVNFQAKIDGFTVDNYTSDGIIVSTPTGSTAYSLSAGGSILAPDINAFIMTPICAHSLHSKPIVYNDNSLLEIIPLGNKTPLNVIVDGKMVNEVYASDIIKVKKSNLYAEFLTRGDNNFFKKLLIKLNIWSK